MPDLPLVCVGDSRIASDHFFVDIAADAMPVRWFAGERAFAPSLAESVAGVAAGRLGHL